MLQLLAHLKSKKKDFGWKGDFSSEERPGPCRDNDETNNCEGWKIVKIVLQWKLHRIAQWPPWGLFLPWEQIISALTWNYPALNSAHWTPFRLSLWISGYHDYIWHKFHILMVDYIFCLNEFSSICFAFYIRHSVRMSLGTSPADPWKLKWSNYVRKNEMSTIWCMPIVINVKPCKKWNETAQTTNFTDFPSIFYGSGPKWSKTMQTQTPHFSPLKKFWGIHGIPCESSRPVVSENVVVFFAPMF